MSNISLTAPAQYVTVIGEVQAKGQKTMGMAQGDIHLLLRERRHLSAGDDDNFSVMDTKEIANMLTGTTTLLTTLLSAVAAVSLLVGGIGIMNIMLVSVTERTRERGSIPTGARASAGGSGAAIGDGSGYGSRRRWRAA